MRQLGWTRRPGLTVFSIAFLLLALLAWVRSEFRYDDVALISADASSWEIWASPGRLQFIATGGIPRHAKASWETSQWPRWHELTCVVPDCAVPDQLDWRLLGLGLEQGTGRPAWIHFARVTVPYWFLALFASLAALMASIMPTRRGTLRRRVGCCVKCGYDLRATPSRCPECGTAAKTC